MVNVICSKRAYEKVYVSLYKKNTKVLLGYKIPSWKSSVFTESKL